MTKVVSAVGPLLVSALVLLAVYVGSYAFLVKSEAAATDPFMNPRVARYGIGGAVAEALFFPAEQVDRQLRHEFWTTPDCLRTWERDG